MIAVFNVKKLLAYIKFNTNFLHNISYLLIDALTCFGLRCWLSSGSSHVFLACAPYSSNYMVGILHKIKITTSLKMADS